MQQRRPLAKIGFSVAVAGLALSLLSLVPAVVSAKDFPWPLLVGSFVYLPGAFLVMIGSRGEQMKEAMGKLRFVRMGFIAVFAIAIMRIVGS